MEIVLTRYVLKRLKYQVSTNLVHFFVKYICINARYSVFFVESFRSSNTVGVTEGKNKNSRNAVRVAYKKSNKW